MSKNTENTTPTLTPDEKLTLQTAAHGVVSLMAAADPGPISSTRSGMAGGKALSSATGLVGRVLAEKAKGLDLGGGSTADLADRVFAALADSVTLLKAKAPGEVTNFRDTITTITDAASRAHKGGPGPAETAMIQKIGAALADA
ncbi:hypothetical protein R6V09_21770 [Streptomyces sp. W16]|uniref:hypothetical protein n=1 Tax=Streptomyces sp. W16 TaxID=3076631 RepID=UPI00295B0BB6|nr:hypothetical protein [Streptomyces sp. W16]MDV9172727.1 hypothetical protein [Streptomyces sp. W16]